MEKISDEILSARSLPLKPAPVILKGKFVVLRPLNIEEDAEILYLISNGSSFRIGEKVQPEYNAIDLIWNLLLPNSFSCFSEFKNYLIYMESLPDRSIFCILDLLANHPIGSISLTFNEPEHLKIEIGWLWISPIAQRTWANCEACLLLLTHVFKLGYRRAQWRCSPFNSRSIAAALKIGFLYEVTFQSSMIMKGCFHDVSFFRILDKEWEQAKRNLENKIYLT